MRFLKIIFLIILTNLILTGCEEKSKKLENKQEDIIDVYEDDTKYENDNNKEVIPVEKPKQDENIKTENNIESNNKVNQPVTYSSID